MFLSSLESHELEVIAEVTVIVPEGSGLGSSGGSSPETSSENVQRNDGREVETACLSNAFFLYRSLLCLIIH